MSVYIYTRLSSLLVCLYVCPSVCLYRVYTCYSVSCLFCLPACLHACLPDYLPVYLLVSVCLYRVYAVSCSPAVGLPVCLNIYFFFLLRAYRLLCNSDNGSFTFQVLVAVYPCSTKSRLLVDLSFVLVSIKNGVHTFNDAGAMACIIHISFKDVN